MQRLILFGGDWSREFYQHILLRRGIIGPGAQVVGYLGQSTAGIHNHRVERDERRTVRRRLIVVAG